MTAYLPSCSHYPYRLKQGHSWSLTYVYPLQDVRSSFSRSRKFPPNFPGKLSRAYFRCGQFRYVSPSGVEHHVKTKKTRTYKHHNSLPNCVSHSFIIFLFSRHAKTEGHHGQGIITQYIFWNTSCNNDYNVWCNIRF